MLQKSWEKHKKWDSQSEKIEKCFSFSFSCSNTKDSWLTVSLQLSSSPQWLFFYQMVMSALFAPPSPLSIESWPPSLLLWRTWLLISFLPTYDPFSPHICQNRFPVLGALSSHSICLLHQWFFAPISSTISCTPMTPQFMFSSWPFSWVSGRKLSMSPNQLFFPKDLFLRDVSSCGCHHLLWVIKLQSTEWSFASTTTT